MSRVEGLITGWLAGCCIERKAWMALTSESYPESAIVLPLAAIRQAASHLEYWVSCKLQNYKICTFRTFNWNLTLSHLSHKSDMPSTEGTANFIPYLCWEILTSGVTSHPLRFTVNLGFIRSCASSCDLYDVNDKSLSTK